MALLLLLLLLPLLFVVVVVVATVASAVVVGDGSGGGGDRNSSNSRSSSRGRSSSVEATGCISARRLRLRNTNGLCSMTWPSNLNSRHLKKPEAVNAEKCLALAMCLPELDDHHPLRIEAKQQLLLRTSCQRYYLASKVSLLTHGLTEVTLTPPSIDSTASLVKYQA